MKSALSSPMEVKEQEELALLMQSKNMTQGIFKEFCWFCVFPREPQFVNLILSI
jgi:hypothetical protein